MPYRIRRSEISDREILGKIHSQAWQETYAGMIPVEMLTRVGSVASRTEVRKAMFAKMTERHGHFLVESVKDEIVGFGDCGPAYKTNAFAPAEIYALYVLRHAQNKGLGKALLDKMLEHLSLQGFNKAGLKVHINNFRAQGFYQHSGGEKIGQITDGDGEQEFVYVWNDLKISE